MNNNQFKAREVTPDGIVHFDASLARRERLREQSQGTSGPTRAAATPAPNVALAYAGTNGNGANGSNGNGSGHSNVHTSQIDAWKARVASTNAPSPPPVPAKSPAPTPTPISQPPVAPALTPAASKSPAESTAPTNSVSLQRFLVQFVVEQTGYPEDIVELDADLEADLGIDSIKKAQMFGEINEYFELDLSKLQATSLDEFTTLRSIVNFLAPHVAAPAQSVAPTQSAIPSQHVAPVAASTPVAAPAPVAAPTPATTVQTTAPLQSFLIQFVVEQTGYPEDIVELDADLEADLGIDSIKKAQMFGEINEYFELDLAQLQNVSLDDFTTLRSIVNFLAPHVASPASSQAPQQVAEPTSLAQSSSRQSPEALQRFLIQFVVEQTGYPEDIVELDADLEADLGIDSIKKAQMFGEINEYFDLQLSAQQNLSLDDFTTLRHVLDFVTSQTA